MSERRNKRALRARQGEVAIEIQSPPKEAVGLSYGLLAPPAAPECTRGLSIATPGIDIFRPLPPDDGNFRPGQRRLEFDSDAPGNVVLQIKRFGLPGIEFARPKDSAGGGLDQVGRNPDLFANDTQTSLQHVANPKLAGNH